MLPCAAVTDADRPSPLARAWFAQWPIWAEVILFLLLTVAYEWLRDVVATEDAGMALRHEPIEALLEQVRVKVYRP